jgi:hypothetical protein
MADIFLSYAAEDRESARKLAAALESTGWSVWWDRRIPAGMTWRQVIQNALDSMSCMVVMWSRHSVESRWVSEEAEEARALGKLVPVMIEEVNPPLGFRSIHAADLIGWDGAPDAPGILQLISDLEPFLGKPHVAATKQPVVESASKRAETPSRWKEIFRQWPAQLVRVRALALSVAGGALVLGAVMWAWPSLQGRETAPAEATPIEDMSIAPTPSPSAPSAPPSGAVSTPGTAAPSPTPSPLPRTVVAKTPPEAEPVQPKVPAAAAVPKKPNGSKSRCGEILNRLQLGETLSDEDSAFLRKECR